MWYPPTTGSNMKTFCRARERKLFISSFVKPFLSQPSCKFIPLSWTSWHPWADSGNHKPSTHRKYHTWSCVCLFHHHNQEKGAGGSLVKAFHQVESRCVCRPLSTTIQAINAIIRTQGKFKTHYCLDVS